MINGNVHNFVSNNLPYLFQKSQSSINTALRYEISTPTKENEVLQEQLIEQFNNDHCNVLL